MKLETELHSSQVIFINQDDHIIDFNIFFLEKSFLICLKYNT